MLKNQNFQKKKKKKIKTIPLYCPCSKKCKLLKSKNHYLCSNKNCSHSLKKNAFPINGLIPTCLSNTMSLAKLADKLDSPIAEPPNLIVIFLLEYLCMKGSACERIDACFNQS